MPPLTPAFYTTEPDPVLLNALATGKRICLIVVEAIAFLSICAWLIPALARILLVARAGMGPLDASFILVSAFIFQFTEPSEARPLRLLGLVFSALVTLSALFILFSSGLPSFLTPAFSSVPQTMAPPIAGGFVLLGIAMALIHAPKPRTGLLPDAIVLALCFLVLALISGEVFHSLGSRGLWLDSSKPILTLICLALLTWVAILQYAQTSIFAVFLGRGIGGSIARFSGPILLTLPFLRETARLILIGQGRIPPIYVTAIVTSSAAMIYFGVLVYITWRISKMEGEINDLSLRDELTSLYNLRGFNLLAEQSLRMAQRTQVPFSVLFIDLDNLKQINDSFGHNVGSSTLAETANLLRQTFRETDIIGRIGGDEFAIAGQFSHAAISVAIQRLRESAAFRNTEVGRQPQLNFSLGQYTSEANSPESLLEMLSRADNAMYEEKRHKKAGRV